MPTPRTIHFADFLKIENILCHMKAGGEVEPEHFETLSNCTTCHHWENPDLPQEAELTVFHRDILERGIACQKCHAKVIGQP